MRFSRTKRSRHHHWRTRKQKAVEVKPTNSVSRDITHIAIEERKISDGFIRTDVGERSLMAVMEGPDLCHFVELLHCCFDFGWGTVISSQSV